MTTLGRWLADILNAHIERHNVPVAEPEVLTVEVEIDTTRFDDALQRLTAPAPNLIPRPCWNCGVRAAFDAHRCGEPLSAMDATLALAERINNLRVQVEALSLPSGCRYCDRPERDHGLTWHFLFGYHAWTPPTNEQRQDRLRIRRTTETT